MKRLIVVLLIIALLIIGLILTQKDSSSSIADILVEPSALFTQKQEKEAESSAQPSGDNAKDSDAGKETAVSAEFKNWVSSQALELEKSSVNPQQIEDDLTKRSLQLTSYERVYLQTLVLDQASPGNQKILSVYVLGLDANGSRLNLEEIVKAPLAIGSDYKTHSPEETLSMQEKTLRRLAIDSLIEKAKVEASYKTQLQAMAKDIADPTLKRYLERKIQEIP